MQDGRLHLVSLTPPERGHMQRLATRFRLHAYSGEVESIALASARGLRLVVDDKEAKTCGRSRGGGLRGNGWRAVGGVPATAHGPARTGSHGSERGTPVAERGPVRQQTEEYPQRSLRGSVRIVGDIVSPALPPEAWEANREGRGLDSSDT